MLDKDEKQAEQSSGAFISQAHEHIGSLQGKLQRLLDGYLDQDIDQQTYRTKQAELMSEKKSLEEQIAKLKLAGNVWIEPMRQWIKQAIYLCEIANSKDRHAIKDTLMKMDGLNLFLVSKKVQPQATQNTPFLKNIWLMLQETKEKTAHVRRNSEFCPFLVRNPHITLNY